MTLELGREQIFWRGAGLGPKLIFMFLLEAWPWPIPVDFKESLCHTKTN